MAFPPFNLPSTAILCYDITYLTHLFQSARCMRNYIAGVRFLHKEFGLTLDTIHSFPVTSLIQVADLTITPPPPPKKTPH